MKSILHACLIPAALILMGAGLGEDTRKRPVHSLLPSAPSSHSSGQGPVNRPERAERVERGERVVPVERAARAERTERAIRGQTTREDKPAAVASAGGRVGSPSSVGVRELNRIEQTETEPNRHYWHTENNVTYTHYYTGQDHWYGFYAGPSFYWTQYYGSNWWYYDSYGARWVYWYDGFWWYPGPGGAYFFYLDGRYYPYQEDRVDAAIRRAYAEAPKDATTVSADNRRMAQVLGADAQAFLYDKTVSPPKFMKYLGPGVSKVRFTAAGEPARIIVERKNGTFALLDADGNPQKPAGKKGDRAAAAPPKPASIPPAPTSAPGH